MRLKWGQDNQHLGRHNSIHSLSGALFLQEGAYSVSRGFHSVSRLKGGHGNQHLGKHNAIHSQQGRYFFRREPIVFQVASIVFQGGSIVFQGGSW